MRNKETDMTLEKRIETAIAENTDPFTTDADIRFFETEEWNAAKVTLGTKIIGDFGGYGPLWNGEVVNRSYRGRRVIINKEVTDYMVKVKWDDGEVITISTYDTGPTTPEVKVKWDNGSTTWICASEIDAWTEKSKIGYYTEDGYYG